MAKLDPLSRDLVDSSLKHLIGGRIYALGYDHVVAVGSRAPRGSAEPKAKVLTMATVAMAESQGERTPGEVAVVDWSESDHGQRNGVDLFRILRVRVGVLLELLAFDEFFGFKLDGGIRDIRVGLGAFRG